MSTWIYLVCNSHTPPIKSDSEVGQHLTDLPAVRDCLARRDELVKAENGRDFWEELNHRPAYPAITDIFHRNTVTFLTDHPHCDLSIRDEYGDTHPNEAT